MSPERNRSNALYGSGANEGSVQKPVLEIGEEVMSAWWDDEGDQTWWSGIVTDVTVVDKKGFGYGPIRHYDIGFDDGDHLSSVQEAFVFSKEEYNLSIKFIKNHSKKWTAIEHITDEDSEDLWAQKVGWYDLSVDGKPTESFALLGDALKAYKRRVKKPKFSKDEEDASVGSSFSCLAAEPNTERVCSHCNKAFKSKSGFEYHVAHKVCESDNAGATTPQNLQAMICGYCSKEFKSKLGFAYHVDHEVCRKTCANPSSKIINGDDAEYSLCTTFEASEHEIMDKIPDKVYIATDNETKLADSLEVSNVEDGNVNTDMASILTEKEGDVPQPDPEQLKPPAAAAAAAVRTMPSSVIKLNPDQTHSTKFPVGCNVWTNLNLNSKGQLSFQKGTVIGAQVYVKPNASCEVIYDVSVSGSIHQYGESDIIYAEKTPIMYSPSGLFGQDIKSGQVIVCRKRHTSLKFNYTVMLGDSKDSNTFKVIEDVPSEHIKYTSPRV